MRRSTLSGERLVRMLVCCGLMLCAGQTQTQPAAPAAPSADGAYVIDPRSKLAWPRCVEGMQWNGKTCTGQARRMTHGEALALAGARFRAEGVAWRCPA